MYTNDLCFSVSVICRCLGKRYCAALVRATAEQSYRCPASRCDNRRGVVAAYHHRHNHRTTSSNQVSNHLLCRWKRLGAWRGSSHRCCCWWWLWPKEQAARRGQRGRGKKCGQSWLLWFTPTDTWQVRSRCRHLSSMWDFVSPAIKY